MHANSALKFLKAPFVSEDFKDTPHHLNIDLRCFKLNENPFSPSFGKFGGL